MKKVLLTMSVIVILTVMIFGLTGCTMQIETTDNSVSASVDGDTTQKVDSVLDWIKERISRVFEPSSNSGSETTTGTGTARS